jgi:RNA-directed DNA polymerase
MTEENILFLMMDMPIVRKGQMALNKNPFFEPDYFENRARRHRYNRKKAMCFNRAAQIGYYAL